MILMIKFIKDTKVQKSQYSKHKEPINNKTDWKLPSEIILNLRN